MKKLSIIFSLFILYSCNQNEELIPVDNNNLIIGSWSHPEYLENSITSFQRVDGVINDNYTCTINNDGSLTEHKNGGWCGTPPISYANFEGNWTQENETLCINSNYWGGTQQVNWKIISLTDTTLRVKITYQN